MCVCVCVCVQYCFVCTCIVWINKMLPLRKTIVVMVVLTVVVVLYYHLDSAYIKPTLPSLKRRGYVLELNTIDQLTLAATRLQRREVSSRPSMAPSVYESINRTRCIRTSVNYNFLLVYRNQPKLYRTAMIHVFLQTAVLY